MLVNIILRQCSKKSILCDGFQTMSQCRNKFFTGYSFLHTLPVKTSSNAVTIAERIWNNISAARTLSTSRVTSTAYEFGAKVKNDVFLYVNDEKNFKLIKAFSFLQTLGWLLMAQYIYRPELLSIFSSNISMSEYFQKCGMHLVLFVWPFFAGSFIFSIIMIYLSRTVKCIVLHKNGNAISVVTFSLFGRDHKITGSVNDIGTVVSRSESKGVIPMKIRGRKFYYLISTSGEFVNASLYDNTIGYRKNWQK